jgi:hypothetical protein
MQTHANELETYRSAMVMYGIELINPMIQEFCSHVPAALQGVQVPSLTQVVLSVSGIPNSSGNERFAPLDPVKRVFVSMNAESTLGR